MISRDTEGRAPSDGQRDRAALRDDGMRVASNGDHSPAPVEVELQQLTELLELGDAFFELDQDFRVVRVNRMQEVVSRLPRSETLGRVFWEAWPETACVDSKYWQEYHRCMEARVSVQFDAYYPPLDIWTSVTAHPTSTGGIAVFFRDVTAQKRAEEALRRSEEQRRLALDAAQLGTWDYNLVTGDVYWDERFKAIYGRATGSMPYEELVSLLVHVDDRERVDAAVQRALDPSSDGIVDIEYRVVWQDGSTHWVMAKGQAFFEGQGADRHATRFIGTAADINERKGAEAALLESEAQFRQLSEVMPQLIWMTRPDGYHEYFNRRWYDYTGATLEESEGDRWSHWLHPDDVQRAIRAWNECVSTGQPYEIEYRFRHASDGSYRWFLGRALPVRDQAGRIVRWFGTCTEVHDLKQAQAELADAKSKLEDADRRKNDFLAVLSHELRNPLAPIQNSIYILDRTPPDGEQARRARRVIYRQVQHMTRLVDDLLDVTRIARGKVTLQRVSIELNDLAKRAAEDHRESFARHGIELVVRDAGQPLFIHGDPVRLAQVIGNLLHNALKFTPRGGRTALCVEAKPSGEGVVRVRDNGVGLAGDTTENVFEPFVQADSTLDRSRGGLGLGLALVKGIVEMHGGRVQARSEGLGQGAEISFSLPLEAGVEPGPSTEPSGKPATQTRRVLIVEDNEDAASSLRELLELAGHEVVVADSGPQGLETASSFEPDVVLCDIGLPGMDGYAMAARLRADARFRSTLLVALSGYALLEDVERSKRAGFDQHMAKPPDLDALYRLLACVPGPSAT